MKLAIIGTTINGERGYLAFDRLAAKSDFSDVTFVIAGDVDALPFDRSKFSCRVEYLEPKDQERFAISETIGWKTPRRRPLAWLRAIELQPDVIISIDDDNIPPDDYFDKWYRVLTEPVRDVVVPSGVSAEPVWHNYLRTSDAPFEIFPRGYPVPFRSGASTTIRPANQPIEPHEIGLWQAISLGDPDMDAMTRLVFPKRLPLRTIQEKNYCLRNIWSPYNMQSTAFSNVLFGLPILWPHAGRFDDIFASFVWQKFLFNNGMYAHIGDPVNVQDRGVRDTLNADFREEVEGYFCAHRVWETINAIPDRDLIAFTEKLAALGERGAGDLDAGLVHATLAAVHPPAWRGDRKTLHPFGRAEAVFARNQSFFRAYLKDLADIL